MPLDARGRAPGRTSQALLLCLLGGSSALGAAEYWVAVPSAGSNGNPGSFAAPWATLQFAADSIGPGDTVWVRAGQYAAFEVTLVATGAQPAAFRAWQGELVEIVTDLPVRNVAINLEGAEWVTIEGFRANGRGVAGIRAALCSHVTIRGNVTQNNGVWGIFTGCCDDLVIEGNLASGSCAEHGIYVSNSGDRPIVRRNVIFGNDKNGLHMNGDLETECDGGTAFDGVISDALVEDNWIFDNGDGSCSGLGGGSGINCDGVEDSLIRNNLLWNEHHSGVSLYQDDGGAPSNGNQVIGNTIHLAPTLGRWAINLMNGAAGTVLRDNILWSDHSFRGAISACATCLTDLDSDFNAVEDRFSVDGGSSAIDLAAWRAATGGDASSFVANPLALVVDAAAGDYRLAPGSSALEVGTPHALLPVDCEGTVRPAGTGVDIGAFEGVATLFRDDFEAGSIVRWDASVGAGPF